MPHRVILRADSRTTKDKILTIRMSTKDYKHLIRIATASPAITLSEFVRDKLLGKEAK